MAAAHVAATTKQVDERLGRNYAQLLQRRIDFHQERRPDPQQESLRRKYTPINNVTTTQNNNATTNPTGKVVEDELPLPKKVLFKPDLIVPLLKWSQPVRPIGPGLVNMGNTCFLNSVLQCLTYTPPLYQYLLSGVHGRECKLAFCMMCELETHIQRCTTAGKHAIRPEHLVGKLQHVVKHMRVGRQEDAHEYARFLVESLQKSCLQNMQGLDNRTKETTFVHQTFGSYLRSQVICLKCKYRSNTFDPFLDISLDIQHCDSIDRALFAFTKPERLDGENRYKCSRCHGKVPAVKRFSIHVPPNILTLQLKRFDFVGMGGRKLNRHVNFSEKLNLAPFMSQSTNTKQPPIWYNLYAVLVHSGASVHSGHYYSFVKSPAGVWYHMDDQSVRQVGLNAVLTQPAYMLFYVRHVTQTTISQLSASPQLNGQPNKRIRTESTVEPVPHPVAQLNGDVGKKKTGFEPNKTVAVDASAPEDTPPTTTDETITFGSSGTWTVLTDQPKSSSPSLKSKTAPTSVGDTTTPTSAVPKKKKKKSLPDHQQPNGQSSDKPSQPPPQNKPSEPSSQIKPSANGINGNHVATSLKRPSSALFGEFQVGTWGEEEEHQEEGASDITKTRDSFLQQQAKQEAKERRARMLDPRDSEYDLGRVKKVKKPKEHSHQYGFNARQNPFQKLRNDVKSNGY